MKALSFCQGKGVLRHNNRDFLSPNIDPDRVGQNVYIKQESLEEAYEKCFGAAVERFNEKQTRNDRKIKVETDKDGNSRPGAAYFKKMFGVDPSEHHAQNNVLTAKTKQNSFYEDIVQIGDMDDSGCGEWVELKPPRTGEGLLTRTNAETGNLEFFAWDEDVEKSTAILLEYAEKFQENNPNLYVFNIVLHLDEKTPHLHINWIPLAHYPVVPEIKEGEKPKRGRGQGLDVQNGLAKALSEMGFGCDIGKNKEGKEAVTQFAVDKWRIGERNRITEIASEFGVQIKPPEKSRGTLKLPAFKRAKDEAKEEIKELKAEAVQLRGENEAARVERDDLAAEIETQNTTKANNQNEIEVQEGKLTEINAAVTALEENKGTLKKEVAELEAETEQHRKTLADAEARLKEALEPIEEQIDVALAEKANINVIKDIAVKKSLTGAIVLSRETKGKTLTVEQVESALELAKNQRSHEIRCNNKVEAAVKEVAEVKEKAQEDVGAAKRETAEHKAVAKEATDAWRDTIAVYNGVTSNNKPYVTSPADVPKAAKFFKDGYYEQKKAAESVPELERQVKSLTSQVSTLQQERDTAKNALQRTENALSKGLDCFTFTKEGNKVMVGCDFNAFVDAVKGEKPDHRVLERCRERERELNRLLNIGLSR